MGRTSDEFRRLIADHSERRAKERLHRAQQRLKEKQKQRRENAEDELSFLVDVAATIASVAEVEATRTRLARYEVAVAEAIAENEEALARARKDFAKLMERAYVLPDGRHVFKTRDGKYVFDEHGQEVGADIIAPDTIPNDRPFWEDRNSLMGEIERREQLSKAQNALHRARRELDQGEITKERLDEIDEELKDALPDYVKKKVGLESDRQTRRQARLKPEYERAVAAPSASNDVRISPSLIPS